MASGPRPLLDDAETARLLGPEVTVNPWSPGAKPIFIAPARADLGLDDAKAWLVAREEQVAQVLAARGAVVLRGFPITSTDSFAAMFDHYEPHGGDYTGGVTRRDAISDRVFEASKSPAPWLIGLHQEMAYLPRFPKMVAFYSHLTALTGGETIIGDIHDYQEQVSPAFLRRLKDRGVTYLRNFGAETRNLPMFHKSWRETFHADTPEEAEATARAMGMDCAWEDDGSLTVRYVASGFTAHPRTGERVFFNQIASQTPNPLMLRERWDDFLEIYGDGRPWPIDTRYGDGGEIAPEDIADLWTARERVTQSFPWCDGDVMVVDNIYTMHGRNPFTGPRDMQVSLFG